MKIAITGSSSLLGQHIYQLLFLRNYNLKLIDKNIWNITDIATFDIFDNIFDKCQIIIHCAAVTDNLPNDPSGSAFEINITSTSFLAQWCYTKKVKLIYISGAGCYDYESNNYPDENSIITEDCHGGEYGKSKYLAERDIRSILNKENYVIIRPSSIYGFGMKRNRFIAQTLSNALIGKDIELNQGGNKINLVHASDVANAIYSTILKEKAGIFNIGGYVESYRSIAETCIKACKSSSKVIENDISNQEKYFLNIDYSLARMSLGYIPEVNLLKGLNMMIKKKYTFPDDASK